MSVSQINRLRAALGLRKQNVPREKKPEAATPTEPLLQESAGSLLLLAAAMETGLLAHLTQALPQAMVPSSSSRHLQSLTASQRRLMTLLFLGTVGLKRPGICVSTPAMD